MLHWGNKYTAENIGTLMKTIREDNGFSISDVQTRSGLCHGYVEDIEKGIAKPTLKALLNFSNSIAPPSLQFELSRIIFKIKDSLPEKTDYNIGRGKQVKLTRGKSYEKYHNIGLKLKEIRYNAGYKTAKEFALSIKMHPSTMLSYERGVYIPSEKYMNFVNERLKNEENAKLIEDLTAEATIKRAERRKNMGGRGNKK